MIKLASTGVAHPGDEVRFTIRYDNMGDLPISKITIVDNLTTRLEYVDDSQQCTHTADFSTHYNDSHSLLLQWTISDTLEPGDGGVIRFTCRVR